MYDRFGLVLVMNHACNMRCTYCYTGEKSNRPMPEAMGRKAIDRALASIADGGTLELGFFGGEPLVEAPLIESLTDYARREVSIGKRAIHLGLSLTTNGTITTPAAWRVLMNPHVNIAISCDGLPEIHDLQFLHYYEFGPYVHQGRQAQCDTGYFVMGDDSRDSFDSRFTGPLHQQQITGRPLLIVWPLSRFGWANP